MPVELRKRKAPPPPPEPPAKKQTKPKAGKSAPASDPPATENVTKAAAKAAEAVKQTVAQAAETASDAASAVATAATTTATNGGDDDKSAKKIPEVGDVISLEGFGGEVETNDGDKVTLKGLVDESKAGVVLVVYPRANTGGCRKQVCFFRDSYEPFQGAGLSVYGLSTDSPKSNTTFKVKEKLQYPLLCDPSGTLLGAIGLKKASSKSATRGVFVVDKNGKVLASGPGSPEGTLNTVKDVVKELGASNEEVEEKKEEPTEEEAKAEEKKDEEEGEAKANGEAGPAPEDAEKEEELKRQEKVKREEEEKKAEEENADKKEAEGEKKDAEVLPDAPPLAAVDQTEKKE